MDFRLTAGMIQRVLLILFVFIISLLVGWYGERAVESFINSGTASLTY